MRINYSIARLCMTAIFVFAVSGLACCKGSDDEPKLDPLQEKAQEHYLKGRRLFLTCDPNNYPLAIEEFQQALAYWDEYPEALAAFAETYSMWRGFSLTEQQFGEAYRNAQRALRLNPELAAGYRAIADLYRHRLEIDRAQRQIETAIQLEPDNAENYYVLGSTLLSTDPEQALKALIKAASLNPDLPKTYYNLAAAYHLLNDLENAEKAMLHYQKIVPNDPSGNTELGLIYRDMGRIEDAVKQFQQAVTQPYSARPWERQWLHRSYLQLAEIYFEHYKDYGKALDFLLKAEEVIPNNLEVAYYTGLTYQRMGLKENAAQFFEKALAINPDYTPAQEALKNLKK